MMKKMKQYYDIISTILTTITTYTWFLPATKNILTEIFLWLS